MPLPSLHPSLPQNPTAGSSSYGTGGRSSLGSAAVASSANAGGSVNRDTLKGLQDVVWSDDEDDPDCLLCAEPLDLSDLNFKPCQCGLQICQFCYNKLLGSDPRCPGCRRLYDQKSVIFQPVDFEEVKRAKEKKTKRAKTIKQLTTMGRRHLLGTRVVMKNMVYVIGMPLPSTPEESPSILRTHEYFGQYGKIAKIYIRERSLSSIHTLTPDDPSTTHGIYIIFTRREDAARAIALINANTSVNGFSASYGTTRYCDAFLRGMKCDQSNCHNLHEWGGESDCFSKDDYETALTKPAEYDARQKQAQVAPPPLAIKSHWPKPNQEDLGSSALPNSAGWGKNITVKTLPAKTINGGPKSLKIGNMVSLKPTPGNTNAAFPLPSPSVLPIGSARSSDKKKSTSAAAAAMSRGKSSDSTQSTNPPSSTQASPRKKPISLTTSSSALASSSTPASSTAAAASAPAPAKTAPPPGIAPPLPPPGLGPPMVQTSTSAGSAPTTTGIAPLATATATASASAPVPATAAPAPTADLVTEEPMPEETMSADSEAGPSSSSPAPQTPSQPSEPALPAPLTSDPIFVHSPYEEPEFFPFPTTSDPDFEFVLGLDFGSDSQGGSSMSAFTPTPFSKTLMGLADLGVLSTDIPEFQAPRRTFTSNFQPFDLSSSLPEDEEEDEYEEDTPQAGPSRSRERDREDLARQAMSTPHRDHQHQQEAEPPRTTSRFDFARQSSSSHTPNSYSRGQSPFAMRTGTGNGMGGVGGGAGDWGMMSTRQMQHQQLLEEQLVGPRQHRQDTGDSSRASALVQQDQSFVGSYGSSAGQGQEWHQAQSQQSHSQAPSQGQGQGQGSSEYIGSPIRLDGRMSQLSLGRHPHPQTQAQRDEYDHHPPYPGPQRLFSPVSSIHDDQQQQHYHPHQQQQQQQQSQYTPLHQNFYQQQQQQQARGQSPVPMSINPHSFRRY